MTSPQLITETEAAIALYPHPEETRIEGNASAIDEETDRETCDWIRHQLRHGNPWAWCMIEVRATWRHLHGSAYLGCCSYRSEAEFREPGGYFDDMKSEALEALNQQIDQSGEH